MVMKKYVTHFSFLLLLIITGTSCSQNKEIPEVTFIELGSVRCIPCQKMQKVIKKVEEKYPTKVKTVFYDVWTEEGKEKAKAFEFDMIPTQIFLDKNGKEYARHVGYFEFSELEKILQQKIH
jgi:thioredoxin 1